MAAVAANIAGVSAALTAAKVGAAVGMKDGGVVPAGYPNDSYHAMLTSGETVTPPGKLPGVNGGKSMRVVFEGKLKGKDMYLGVVRYMDELETNT